MCRHTLHLSTVQRTGGFAAARGYSLASQCVAYWGCGTGAGERAGFLGRLSFVDLAGSERAARTVSPNKIELHLINMRCTDACIAAPFTCSPPH